MKLRRNLLLSACALLAVPLLGLLGLACKKAPSATPPDAGPAAAGAGPDAAPPAPPELSARVVMTGAPLNKQQAQIMGMQFAAKRWPQYHPRFAEALHEPTDWRVIIQFQEPGVGGMVVFDLYGALLDAGTSTGEH